MALAADAAFAMAQGLTTSLPRLAAARAAPAALGVAAEGPLAQVRPQPSLQGGGAGQAYPATAAFIGVGALCRGAARRARRRAAAASLRPATACAVASSAAATDEVFTVQTKEAPDNLREWRLQSQEKLQASGKQWPAPENDRLLRAARGEQVDRPPKWMMRQAGRYLPEYMEVSRAHDFFEVCRTPALACEVTLQPWRRYPTLDSLIIFSDILVIPVAMGMPCRMEPKTGPKFDFALETPEDIKKLNLTPDVDETLGYVFDAIFWTRQCCDNKVPVIGFSGAPWTLMGYMVEGGAVRSFDNAKKWLYLYPEESKKLLRSLRDCVVEYLVGQFDAGAPLLTVFDTNCGEIPPRVYEEFCVPDLKYIATEVKRRRPTALMTVFPKDGENSAFNDSAYDCVGVGWKTSPAEARRQCPDKVLQGNLDPHVLYADPEAIRDRTLQMVQEFGVHKYIANLGHGMLPSHPVGGPRAFINAVDSCTKEVVAAWPKTSGATSSAATQGRPSSPPLTLHLQDTSVSVPIGEAGAKSLQEGLSRFVASFKEKLSAEKAKKWDNFEYGYSTEQGDLRLEVFCNPNAYATIFDVRMFLTVKCGNQIKVSSEVPLSSLQSDVQAFLS